MCFFRRFKMPNQHLHAVSTNTRSPAFSYGMPRYAQQATFISFMRLCLVLCIVACCYISKVVKSIVRRIAVYMVNVVYRPSAIDVHPSKSVSAVAFSVQRNNKVQVPVFSASYGSNLDSSIGAYLPPEDTSFKVVVQHLFNNFTCNSIHSWSIA